MSKYMESVDVLILTSADGEDEALRAVDDGAMGPWETAPHGRYAVRSFRGEDGRPLRVAHAHARAMGETTAAIVATQCIEELQPKALAMCGVCAGRPKWTNLGDIIVADLLYKYDAGEQVREVDRPMHFKPDGRPVRLSKEWRDRALNLRDVFNESPAGQRLLADRPMALDLAELWLLDMIDRCQNHDYGRQVNLGSEAWRELVIRLESQGDVTIEGGHLIVSSAGQERLSRERLLRRDRIAAPELRIHVAPFGTGSALVRDADIWDRISEQARHVRGLDMEAAAVGEAGWHVGIEPTLVVKGVMDFAEPGRTQHFRPFAARASAEFLLALLRQHLRPIGRFASDVLTSGTFPKPAKATNPGSLLHPRYEVIKFVDVIREKELALLRAWCARDDPVAARLFTGPGGTGKTRLLMEWAKRLRAEGWAAGFLDSVDDLDVVLGSPTSAFVIVDYADTRRDLIVLLERVARHYAAHGPKLRIVLIAREVADWWRVLLNSSEPVGSLLRVDDPTALSAVAPNDIERRLLFDAAASAFADVLQTTTTVRTPDLSHRRFGRPLYIAMVAYAALHGEASDAETIVHDTLQRERRLWAHRFRDEIGTTLEDLGDFETRIAHFMAAVTLRGGVARGEPATSLLRSLNGPPFPRLVDFLANIYPARDSRGRVTGLAPVEPDLLGEQLVLEVLGDPETPEEFLDIVFAQRDIDELSHGFSVLGRLGTRGGVDVARSISRLIGTNPESVLEPALRAILASRVEDADTPVGELLAKSFEREGGSVAAAQQILNALPEGEPSLALRELRVWTTRRMLYEYSGPNFVEQQAGLLNSLGARLSDVGQHGAALAAAREALGHYRTLAAQHPNALPALAGSLSNLGIRLPALGQLEDALKATREAVSPYRTLAAQRPAAFLPNLAASLNNLGLVLRVLDQPEAALKAMSEAVRHRSTLAAQRPDAFLPDLATSLDNLGVMLSEVGQPETALEVAEDSVRITTTLTRKRPVVFGSVLVARVGHLQWWLEEAHRDSSTSKAFARAMDAIRDLGLS